MLAWKSLMERGGTACGPLVINTFARVRRQIAPVTEASAPSKHEHALAQISRSASSSEAPPPTAIAQIIPETTSVVYLVDPRVQELWAAHAHGPSADDLRGVRIPIAQRLSGWVAAHRRTIVNSDAALDLYDVALSSPLRSCLSMPLVDGNALVGVLSVYAARPRAFTEEHSRMMEVIAPHLAQIALRMTQAQPQSLPATRELRLVGSR
jgi:GAF domain-containing protein